MWWLTSLEKMRSLWENEGSEGIGHPGEYQGLSRSQEQIVRESTLQEKSGFSGEVVTGEQLW